MASPLPLLVFPQAKTIAPPKGKGFRPSHPHHPRQQQAGQQPILIIPAEPAEQLSSQKSVHFFDSFFEFPVMRFRVCVVLLKKSPRSVLTTRLGLMG